ncbi:aminotransferase class V-fold PLP-dependent enzyme [Millisia brevis]|uniref:aminotransferase class V-fold PLP-dependent enzyme n=1 Tax=Millisia brevis TaxID=264148 RepID=UPI000B22D6C0|nr:aminotransferase class V-fold PLP-dependent enzyme [Millisia brevis]
MRAQFPILTAQPDWAYLDSSATAQKPAAVFDAVHTYLNTINANAGRGTYSWANETTAIIDRARTRVARFLGDPRCPDDPRLAGERGADESTVTFVEGASGGLRRLALDWLVDHVRDGDHILVPFADHQANLLPWLEARDRLAANGVRITVDAIPYESARTGDYDIERLKDVLSDRTTFVAVTHVHHVYGNDMNIHRIREAVGPDVVICLDAAQSVGHLPVDVGALDVDFVVLAGHKAMALPGIGAIWSRNRRGRPFTPAGWSGTPNTSGVVSLVAALDWLETVGIERIHTWTTALGALLTDALQSMDAYEVLGCQSSLTLDSKVQRRVGIVTFRHRHLSSNDLGFILDSRGVMVRADGHCQGSDGERTASVRASMHAYTSLDEIGRLIEVMRELADAR